MKNRSAGLSRPEGAGPFFRKANRLALPFAGASLSVPVSVFLVVVVFSAEEEAGDRLGVGIASVVQARQPEGALDGLQQREVRVEASVFHAVHAVIGKIGRASCRER